MTAVLRCSVQVAILSCNKGDLLCLPALLPWLVPNAHHLSKSMRHSRDLQGIKYLPLWTTSSRQLYCSRMMNGPLHTSDCLIPDLLTMAGKAVRVLFLLLIFMERPAEASSGLGDGLVDCLQGVNVNNFTIIGSPSYYSLLNFSIQNLRYAEATVARPYAVILPQSSRQVQQSVICCRREGWLIRVRSGGHSYEGLSWTADAPFVVIDLANLNAVRVDLQSKTAWVQGGATLGETYYAIASKTGRYGFPAGSCSTVGAGGHISGGGFGLISRKHGLAADHVIDARLVNARGELLDRKRMGEDAFWALRGGGGGSWGIVVAWRIALVAVPPVVTVVGVSRSGRKPVTELVHRWQSVGPFLDDDFYLNVYLAAVRSSNATDIGASFNGLYLGPPDEALRILNGRFPELGVLPKDCKQMNWIQSVLYFAYLPAGKSIRDLADRSLASKGYFKAKSDYVRIPIAKSGLEGAWRYLEEEPQGYVIFDPYGGRMARIPADEIPFPHRAGNLYSMQYQVVWSDGRSDAAHLAWSQRFYEYMTPYVSHSPRAAYVNYADLDLGSASDVLTRRSAVETARESWGEKYFLGNFERLVGVKSRVDPDNVFRNFQSIPVKWR